jgi:hypothetical protein
VKTERWAKIERLFHDARELRGADRSRFLDEACGMDASIRRDVEALLAHESGADGFLTGRAMDLIVDNSTKAPTVENARTSEAFVVGRRVP